MVALHSRDGPSPSLDGRTDTNEDEEKDLDRERGVDVKSVVGGDAVGGRKRVAPST